MRRAIHITAAAGLALAAVAAGELPDGTCASQEVFFSEGDSKLGNLGASPWDTEAPTTSVEDGAGAGSVAVAGSATDLGGADTTWTAFAGTYEGCLQTLQVDLYSYDLTSRSGTDADLKPNPHNFAYELLVDGVVVMSGSAAEALTTFTIGGVGPNLNQFALEVGPRLDRQVDRGRIVADGVYDVELRVVPWYTNTGHGGYLWDAVEFPSGMTFDAVDEGVPVVG